MPSPRKLSIALLLVACGICNGCLYLLARSIVDPSGLVKDVGRAYLAHNVENMLAPGEVDAIASTERMVSDLRRIIAENPDAANRDQLTAMANQLDARLAAQRQARHSATAELPGLGDNVKQPWSIEDPSTAERFRDRDYFRTTVTEVHLHDPVEGNGAILSMERRLLGAGDTGVMTDQRFINEFRYGKPVQSGYSSAGWVDGPPPDSMLSDPPPPE